jgi:hypothetical protein
MITYCTSLINLDYLHPNKWFQGYLLNRSSFVRILGVFSSIFHVLSRILAWSLVLFCLTSLLTTLLLRRKEFYATYVTSSVTERLTFSVLFLYFVFNFISSFHLYQTFIHSPALIVQDGPLTSLFGVSWSHTSRHTVGPLWTSDHPVTETSTYTGQHNI